MEGARKKKVSVNFIADHSACLLVLRRQVEKENKAQEQEANTQSMRGVLKANDLKCAFRKLWLAYKKPLKLYVQAKREAQNVLHRTPLLCLQLTGSRAQDHVSWAKFPKFESNCPVPECGHVSTMPLQSWEL